MIACAHCGTAMPTPTGRASRKRYCNVDCRKAAWRERHRHDNLTTAAVVSHIVPGVLAVPTAFPDDVPTRGGQHRCPHCRQPLAIVSVVIPADAAIIRPPEVLPLATQTANLESPPGEDDLAIWGISTSGSNVGRLPSRCSTCCRLWPVTSWQPPPMPSTSRHRNPSMMATICIVKRSGCS
jgi:hypothetical protein